MPSSPETTERVIAIGGIDVFVREAGSGFPLLLINGIGTNTEMWGVTERTLARGSRTIVFDAPGTGRSSTPVLPLSIAALAQLTRSLLDELGHERADVLGFSFGGLIAQELARAQPGRVRRLALVSTGCGWGSTFGDPAALAAIATPLRYYSRRFAAQASRIYGGRDSDVDRRIRNARLAWPPTTLGYTYQLLAAASWSSLPWLRTLRQPTLVISGAQDRISVPANAVQLARLIGDSRLHLLPGEGHLALYDQRSGAPALLADFFGAEEHAASAAWLFGLAFGDPSDDDDAMAA